MKIVKSTWFPFGGIKAVNICGIVFTKSNLKVLDQNHEEIHTAQMKEMLYIPFYLWYVIEYLVRYIISIFNNSDAYHSISLEQEAYANDNNLNYLNSRKHYGWIKYIKKQSK